MRTYALLFAVAAVYLVACANGFPAIDTSDESDETPKSGVVILPKGFADDDDAGSSEESSSWWRSSSSLFDTSGFSYVMRAMQQAMSQWRREMSEITKRLREQGIGAPWSKIPEGANTTSVTKVIDGHVVTINETTYSDTNDTLGTVIRVRVIDIKPQNETIADTEEPLTTLAPSDGEESSEQGGSTTPGRSVETIEDFDNEIPKNQGDLTA